MTALSERVVVHILTFNNAGSIEGCVRSVFAQSEIQKSEIELWITDNNSTDGTVAILQGLAERWPQISVRYNPANTGFCAGHNGAINRFLATDAEYFLVLNPDIALTPPCLHMLREGLREYFTAGTATPKLLRCNELLEPLVPGRIDAAGMKITRELRHLDRGSGEEDSGQFDKSGFVFGGTGACLLVRRACVEDLLLPHTTSDATLTKIFSATTDGISERRQLFDEGFFAYREDADLAWRAQRLGWRCRYTSKAVAYHTRKVVPEYRGKLPKAINRHSVRNRFLLQLNHYAPSVAWGALIEGFFVRNVLVLAGVLLQEQSSLGALRELLYLAPRALKIRRFLRGRATNTVGEWFLKEIS